MSSPNTLTVTDEGTRPSFGTVDTNPSHNTAETPVSLRHESESPSPSQAITNASPETTYTTTSSSSVTSGVVSDIESLTSLTGTEIMAMRRQRTANLIMQRFCQYLDWISKGNVVRASTEPFHQTSSRSLPRPSLPKSTRCDNIPAPNTGLPGPESFENAESLCLKQLTWFDDIGHDLFMEPTSPGNARDSGIDMTFSGSSTFVELSKEGRSDECLPDPWTALELPVRATSRDSEDLRLSKNLPSGFLTNQISVPWYPSVLKLDDEPELSTKVNGILHDSTPTPNMHLAVNTMRSEIGRPVNDTNQSNGIRKHAAQDDGDHDGRRKRQKVDDGRKFACPFFKRNARKYSKWTSCPGPGWDEIHRVKSHLYRRHELIQCPRCWSTHKNNKSLVAHLQTDPSCEKQQNLSIVDGVTPEQKEKLLSRKKTHGDMTDEEKWRHVYMILFPDDDKDSIPSPYYEESDGSELEDYARFIRREMPPIVRRELEGLPDQDFQNRERLMPRLVEIISNLQSRLLNVYRQSPASGHDPRPQPTTEVDSSHGKPRESGSGWGTTPSASESPDTFTPPPVPDLVVNADEFVASLLGFDFEYNDMEITSEELESLLDDWGRPGDMVNDVKSV